MPEPICQVVCIVAFQVAGCAAAEVDQDVSGQGEGCWMTEPAEDALQCSVDNVTARVGLGPDCSPC